MVTEVALRRVRWFLCIRIFICCILYNSAIVNEAVIVWE
jgi:hypothetical protein